MFIFVVLRLVEQQSAIAPARPFDLHPNPTRVSQKLLTIRCHDTVVPRVPPSPRIRVNQARWSWQVMSGFVSGQSPPLSVTIPGVKLRSYCASGFISCEAHLSQPSFTLHTILYSLL